VGAFVVWESGGVTVNVNVNVNVTVNVNVNVNVNGAESASATPMGDERRCGPRILPIF
jgi:hypothetical protein